MINQKTPLSLLVLLALSLQFLTSGCSEKISTGSLTDDGAWCWFSDPRAIYVDGKVVTGWVKQSGTIEAAFLDVATKEVQYDDLYPDLQYDDHDNPAFTTTGDGRIIAMYTKHGDGKLYYNLASIEGDAFDFSDPVTFDPNDPALLEKYNNPSITYANPYRLSGENDRLYCFGRWTGYKPNVMWSDNNGETWSKSKVMISPKPFHRGNRPYVKYHSDGESKIHMIFTDGHPRVEPTNSVYYAYYEDGIFYKANGSEIMKTDSLPFEPRDASLVYQATEATGLAWIADITADKNGNPVILYTRHPEETDHRYYYARYDGEKWLDTELCKAGKWFPETVKGKVEREPHYFGGMTIHPDNPDIIYLSRNINGIFEIERWETEDGGQTWAAEAVTQNSEFNNVRPYIPRGLKSTDKEVVLWMENQQYIHYTNYRVSVKYQIR